MVTRNLGKIQEALDALNPVQRNINELKYYKKELNSPNHSNSLCASVRSAIDTLVKQHTELVNALILYGTTYQGIDESLAVSDYPDYQSTGVCLNFNYVNAPEHQKGFWEKTWNQIVLGDFSDDATWLGSAISVAAALFGFDAPMDVRDFAANVSKGEWGWAIVSGISLLPVVGIFGKGGKTVSKSAKVLDTTVEIIDTGSTTIKQGSNILDAESTIIKRGSDIVDGGTSTIKQGSSIFDTGSTIVNQGAGAIDMGSTAIKQGDNIVGISSNIKNISAVDGSMKLGGKYSDIFIKGEGSFVQVHHMPAHSSSTLPFKLGSGIKMDILDHKITASFDNLPGAKLFRETQSELIKSGNFRKAIQMDIDDLHLKFGDKYDQHIAEMLEYVDELIREGMIK